jgi:hypothetical protein
MLQAVLVFAHSSSTVPLAAATVVSTLLGIDKILLPNEPTGEKKPKFPKQSVLILSVAEINRLASLRLSGFSGAVLILSSDSFNTLKTKHRILRWGQGSHDACQFPWKLPDLLQKVTELEPMEPENLKMLQKELEAPNRWYQRRVIPSLKKLEKQGNGEALASVATLIEELRAQTPVAFHAVVEIGNRSAQLQQHFQILLAEMGQSDSYEDTQIALLREAFAKWRDLVVKAGEGLGTFS